jgi:para-nitrobenzyl esterase
MDTITLTTHLGTIKGLQHPGHQAFLGIRYAQAPVGPLRFRPPRRIDAWEGTYDATRYGPIAPQAYPDNPPIQLEEAEDCLSLNIYTSAVDGQARPVMVFIHGGGFIIDSGSRPRTDGGPLAECDDVVVVTVEYRLGALGFLFMPGVAPNLGLQDQVCALGWVQHHIADFGGDPGNVTIFGESAGATSVAYLLVMPAAQGLFHKAILESGAFPLETLAENRRYAEQCTHKLLKELKITQGDVAALQQAPLAEIMRAEKKAAGMLLFNDRAFYPVRDGQVAPEDVYGALRQGCAAGIPLIVGVNGEELPLFGTFLKSWLQRLVVKNAIAGQLRKRGATRNQYRALLDHYRAALTPAARAAQREYNQLFSDLHFRVPATLLAEAHLAGSGRAYFYNFVHPAPAIGAALHVLELYFVFGTLGTADVAEVMKVPGTDDELHLSQAMMQAWTSFARTGRPDCAGLPVWPPYDLQRRPTMLLDVQPEVVDAPREPVRKVWAELV